MEHINFVERERNLMAAALTETSLTGATAVGAGTTIDFTVAKLNVSMVIIPTGVVTGGLVAMEASQDGTNWVSHTVIEPMQDVNHGCDNRYGAYRYWRANILAEIVGGGSVSATFMEAG